MYRNKENGSRVKLKKKNPTLFVYSSILNVCLVLFSWFHLDKVGEIFYYEIRGKATDFPYLSQEEFLGLFFLDHLQIS